MAGSADAIIQTLLQGTGYGHTPGDFQQQADQHALAQQSVQHNNFALQGDQQAQQEAQNYSRDVGAWIAAGSPPEALPALAVKYPKQYEAIKAGWDLKDKAQQTADLNFFGQAYAAANNGRTDLAKAQLVARRDAEKEAGVDTKELDDLIGQFDTDPKGAAADLKSVAIAHIYAGDKDGFAKAFGLGSDKTHVITAGGALVDDTGKELYKAEDAKKYEKVDVFDDYGTKIGEKIVRVGGGDGSGTPPATGGGTATAGRTTGGWTPRARNGGDNSDAAVDGKISGASQFLGIGPDDDISQLTPLKIAQAMALSEGGAGSLADRNNNPANMRKRDGTYMKFASPQGGLNAAAALVKRKIANGQTTVRTLIEGLPTGGNTSGSGGGARTVYESAGSQGTGAVPANVDTLAKALVSGQQALPSSFALAKPFWQSVLTRAYQIDPLFDSSKQPARVAAVKAFTGNGKAAQTIGSVNRIASHLSDLYDASEELVGPNLGNTMLNSWVAGAGQAFQPAAARKYKTALPLVADELEKIARNSPGTLHGIEATIENLKAAQSLDERRSAIQEVVSLIHGAVRPLQTQWSDAFTTGIRPPTWVGSRARGVFSHLAPQLDESDIENPAAPAKTDASPRSAGSPSNASAGGVPVHVATMAQAKALPPGTKFVDPHGVARVRP